jgi:hypothetical protein
MALIEILLHGWDVARATDQQVDVSDALGAELLRCVAETADLGRQVGAYGTKVSVADNATDLARRLASRVAVRTDQRTASLSGPALAVPKQPTQHAK